MPKYITVLVLSAMVSGCASYPIAKNLRRQAQPITFNQVTANPKTTQGTIVIWGGRIITTLNSTNGGEIYVFALPLGRAGKPGGSNADTQGRFIAVSPESVDPKTYPPGALVTVAGELDGVRNELLQNVLYAYPVLQIRQIHLWAGQPQQDYYYYYGENPGSQPRRAQTTDGQ